MSNVIGKTASVCPCACVRSLQKKWWVRTDRSIWKNLPGTWQLAHTDLGRRCEMLQRMGGALIVIRRRSALCQGRREGLSK